MSDGMEYVRQSLIRSHSAMRDVFNWSLEKLQE